MSKNLTNMMLNDGLGRTARYLRLSITDRCNFRCRYCYGETLQFTPLPHEKVLRYEEMLRLAKITHSLGVRKIRITGGEPFIRKGCVDFLGKLRETLPDTQLCITTNGVLLAPYVEKLKHLNLKSVNISLDSFDAATFTRLTTQNKLNQVLEVINQLLENNIRVKINAVAMRGITDKQMDSYIEAILKMPVDLRFIEFMPMGQATSWQMQSFISAEELLHLAKSRINLTEDDTNDDLAGPARMFRIDGAAGRLGFISALSSHFCAKCNRLRITSEGNLRLCLFGDKEYRLAPLLRNKKIGDKLSKPQIDKKIAEIILKAIHHKPLGADLLKAKKQIAVAKRQMSGIGG